jgi:hypothetical protein
VDAEPHRLGKLDLRASVADMDLALALRPRLEALASRLAPAVIERVCDAALPAATHLWIDRLDLDLGTMRPDHLETDLLAALERSLSEAIGQALHDARHAPSDAARLTSRGDVALGRFEQYLLTGTAGWPGGGPRFAPAAALRALIETRPADLAGMLRRRGHDRHIVERLVLLADPDALRALLALLAPADAAIILGLIGDVLVAHRVAPSPPLDRLAEPVLERLLWITTFEFLLRDAGPQFNRRRFLGFLLAREAARLGIDYAALLTLLSGAIAAARTRSGFRSSLPVVLEELIAESCADSVAAPRGEERTADSTEDALSAALKGDFGALIAEVRRHAEDRPRLEALIARMDRALFAGVLHRLDPAGAEAMLATIDELATLEREAAPPRLSGNLEPTLRWLTLHYLLHDAGSQFNRRRFAAYLIEREAARAGVAAQTLLRLLHEAVERVGARAGAQTSLAGIIADLLDEAETEASERRDDAPADADTLIGQLDEAAFARLVRHVVPHDAAVALTDLAALVAAHRAVPLVARSDTAFERMVRRLAVRDLRGTRRFDRIALIRRLLRAIARETGTSERALRTALAAAVARTRGTPETILAVISSAELAVRTASSGGWGTAADAAAVAALSREESSDETIRHLRRIARDPVRLLALAATLPEDGRQGLMAALDPHHADRIAVQIAAFARLQAASPLLAIDANRFGTLLWSLAAAHVAKTGRARFDLRALSQALLEGIARYDGVTIGEMAGRMMRGLDRHLSTPGEEPARRAIEAAVRDAAPPAPDQAADRARIERFLRTGTSPEDGDALPDIAHRHPGWLAATLRTMARATPADVPRLIDRLLTWLLPAEALAVLMPDDPAAARTLAARLDRAGPAAWRTALEALLRGRRPIVPRTEDRLAARFDRLAEIAHWIDHGAAPWWAGGTSFSAAALQRATDAEIEGLFVGLPPGSALTRLRRAAAVLDAARMTRLLARIVPWATGDANPLQPMLARLDARRRLDALIGAAAAALDGATVDLEALAQPLPDLPPSVPPATPVFNDRITIGRLLAWLGGASADAAEQAALARCFMERADAGDRRLLAYLTAARQRPEALARWIAVLPEHGLVRLLQMIAPDRARDLLDARAVLDAAWRRTAPFGVPRPLRTDWWTILLALAADPSAGLAAAIDRMIATLTARHADRAPALRGEALRLAGDRGHLAVAAALRRRTSKPMTVKVPPPHDPKRVAEQKPVNEIPAETPEPGHALYIGNAGLVLFGQYLPALFERLGVLSRNDRDEPRIVGLEPASRAVHWLQYLADGRRDAPEPALALNKLLCGLPTAHPILPAVEDDPAAREICDGLIAAVIANWTIIANTSSEGLRETFLQREGRLRHGDDGWDLVVQRKGLDVLIDQIPWSISMVYHRWMPQPIKVTW